MPTGYTAPVQSGEVTDFKDFAFICARAFSANILMRDDPSDTPIKEYEVGQYYYDAVSKARAEYNRLKNLDYDSWVLEKDTYDYAEEKRVKVIREESAIQRKRYEDMLVQVEEWFPPSSDHVEFKKFMASQLQDSITFDCSDVFSYQSETFLLFQKKKLADAKKHLEFAIQNLADEVKRTDERNRWNRLLIDSLEVE